MGDPQLDGTVGHLEVLERTSDVVGGDSEEGPRLLVGEAENAFPIHHDLGHGAGVERHVAQPHLRLPARRLLGEGLRHESFARARRGLGEDPVLEIDRLEERRPRQHHLRAAQEEVPLGQEREAEARQHPGLRLRVEVHERVPAGEQVELGDRSILDEVVAAVDDRAACVHPERLALLALLEVLLAQGRWDRVQRRLRVDGRPRARQGVVVHVGGVDLHAPAKRFRAERLAEGHRERARLFARGAPGAPCTDRCIVALGRQDARNDLGAQELPGGGVAEESGDVDEERVEQPRELRRIDFQVIEVIGVGLLGRPPASSFPGGARRSIACSP
jgi:hypothetical protein